MLPDGIPFAPGRYDIVAAFDVIEHVAQDVESLRPGNSRPRAAWWTVPALPAVGRRRGRSRPPLARGGSAAPVLAEAQDSYFNTLLFPLIAIR
jgi:hypothetical protein